MFKNFKLVFYITDVNLSSSFSLNFELTLSNLYLNFKLIMSKLKLPRNTLLNCLGMQIY
jgi:hypothetical protein